MVKCLKKEEISKLKYAIDGINYVTLHTLEYDNIKVPKGFIFDGVTVKVPFTFIFSTKDLRQGIEASCFHDYICQHKDKYTKEYATKILIDLWRKNGLNKWKAFIVKISVNFYQYFKKGWKDGM